MRVYLLSSKNQSIRSQVGLLTNAIAEFFSKNGITPIKTHYLEEAKMGDKKDCFLFFIGLMGLASFRGKWKRRAYFFNIDETYAYQEEWSRLFHKFGKDNDIIPKLINCFFDYCPHNKETFASMKLKSILTPIGYHEAFERKVDHKKYDVGFLGMIAKHKRRYAILSSINGFSLFNYYIIGESNFKKGVSYYNSEYLKSKVHLHVHHHDANFQNFPSLRLMLLSIPNKIPMVCEKPSWSPLKEEDHYLTFHRGDTETMNRHIKYLLENPKEAKAMARRAYDYTKKDYHFNDHLQSAFSQAGII